MKTNLSKEQQELLLNRGNSATCSSGNTYFYLPFYYKKTKIENLFDEIPTNEIPEELSRLLGSEREDRPFEYMDPFERNNKMKKIISLFKNGEIRYKTSATFNRVIQMLARDCDEHEIIDHLCSMVDDIQKSLEQHLIEGNTRTIIGSINPNQNP